MWIFWILIIFFSLYYLGKNKSVLALEYSIPLYLIKVLSGLGIGLFYYYQKGGTGDSFYFFNLALDILEKPSTDIYDFYVLSKTDINIDTQRSALFLKFLIPITLVSFKNYWLSCILVSNISFMVLFLIYKRYLSYFSQYKLQLIFSFLMFPSVLLWTSGIFKENAAFICLLCSLLAVLEIRIEKKVSFILIALSLASFYLFFELRYFLAVFLIPILIIMLSHSIPKRSNQIFLILGIALFALIFIMHPVLNPLGFPEFIYATHHNYMKLGSTGLNYYYNFSEASWTSIIYNLPMAFINAFIRPFPWEWQSVQTVIYSLENYLIIMTLIAFLYSMKRQRRVSLLFTIGLIVFALVMLSLATPNFGSLFRYKSICLPFLTFLAIKDFNIPSIISLKDN